MLIFLNKILKKLVHSWLHGFECISTRQFPCSERGKIFLHFLYVIIPAGISIRLHNDPSRWCLVSICPHYTRITECYAHANEDERIFNAKSNKTREKAQFKEETRGTDTEGEKYKRVPLNVFDDIENGKIL